MDTSPPPQTGVTPLFLAAQRGRVELVRLLMSDPRLDVNESEENGFTPLYIAANEGHLEVVRVRRRRPRLNSYGGAAAGA